MFEQAANTLQHAGVVTLRQCTSRWQRWAQHAHPSKSQRINESSGRCRIALATVLREIRHTDLIEPYPRLKAYYARALLCPAWQRTLSLCAERQGVAVADIR